MKKHCLVYGEKQGRIDIFEIYADSFEEAEKKVKSFGYDDARAFDWNIQFR